MTVEVKVPKWAGSADTMVRRVQPILHLIKLGEAVAPSQIDALVKGAYSAKYITFLRLLGFEFSVQKDGRKIVSYTCTKEPANVDAIRNVAPKQKKVKAPSEPKVKAAKKVNAPVEKKAAAKKTAKPASKGGNAATLAKLKEIGKRYQKPADEVEATFGDTGEIGSIDGGWDSIEGLDLSKLV